MGSGLGRKKKSRIYHSFISENKKRSLIATTEIIGHVLMLLVAVSSSSMIYYSVLSVNLFDEEPHALLAGYVIQNTSFIEHKGGEPIEATSDMTIYLAGDKYDGPVSTWLQDDNNDGYWNIGERMIFPFEYELNRLGEYRDISMSVVEGSSNSFIFNGGIQLTPESDAGVEVSISDFSPLVGEEIVITINVTSYGGDVAGSGNISLRCLLPEEFDFIGSESPSGHGSYNNRTGVWSVGDVLVGQPACLDIYTKVNVSKTGAFTQLIMINDGSDQLPVQKWNLFNNAFKKTLANSSAFPHNGLVEFSFITYGFGKQSVLPHAEAYVEPTIITEENYASFDNDIKTYPGGNTPMDCGIRLAADTIYESDYYNPRLRQIVLFVTSDGLPDCEWINGSYNATVQNTTVGRSSTEESIEYLTEKLCLQETQDEINVIVLGKNDDVYIDDVESVNWMNSSIVWPNPNIWNYSACVEFPSDPGWVTYFGQQQWADVDDALSLLFTNLLSGVEIGVEIVDSTTSDPTPENDYSIILIRPQII